MSETHKKVQALFRIYLESNPLKQTTKNINGGFQTPELEVRFQSHSLTKIQYDRVIQTLKTHGLTTENPGGQQMLRIYLETKQENIADERFRAEIKGTDLIQRYCETNSLPTLIQDKNVPAWSVYFQGKALKKASDGTPFTHVELNDWRVRLSLQMETDYAVGSSLGQRILSEWTDKKKLFRLMNRVRFVHPNLPYFVDLTVVKTNRKNAKNNNIPSATIQESGVMTSHESYEVEIEFDNSRISLLTEPLDILNQSLQHGLRMILSGLQNTPYPIPYSEHDLVLKEYGHLLQIQDRKRIVFCGPQSITLQKKHLIFLESSTDPCVLHNYLVTDKADGERHLLYISSRGRIYLLSQNLEVKFTGSITVQESLFHSLLDGEWIENDIHGKSIHLFAAFDVYYINKKSIRGFPFHSTVAPTEKITDLPFFSRLAALRHILSTNKQENAKALDPLSTLASAEPVNVVCKSFYGSNSFFQDCRTVLSATRQYTTDGLIFTPANLAVGAMRPSEGANTTLTGTWPMSIKWKPPQYNTIDFLVRYYRDKEGKEVIRRPFVEGTSSSSTLLPERRVLVLQCGFDSKRDIYINPFDTLIKDILPNANLSSSTAVDDQYKPIEFVPMDPYDPEAYLAEIPLVNYGDRRVLLTTEGQEMEENTIVEFSYDLTKPKYCRWIPLRIRYDKTAQLRAHGKTFGNAYRIACDIWNSIHSPITAEILTGQRSLPVEEELLIQSDVYYNNNGKIGETETKALRDFHNRYVKSKIIQSVSRPGQILLDMAVGKGGDLSKWIHSQLSFVFGIDLSRDNIHHPMNGACARLLEYMKRNHSPDRLRGLFVQGDCSKSIRTGEAFITTKDNEIGNAILGVGPKDREALGMGVYKQYGVGANGFHVTSVQFALHYFWESKEKLHTFLTNVAENTQVDGFFVGTCYDGNEVFQLLCEKSKGQSVLFTKNNKIILEITKSYDATGFPEDENCIGYGIDVFQESINQKVKEYLVHFSYLTVLMESYGFVPLTPVECQQMDLPSSIASFQSLYDSMIINQDRITNKQYGMAMEMSVEEKQISFLNKYFVFKKVRNVVNVAQIRNLIGNRAGIIDEIGNDDEVLDPPVNVSKAPLFIRRKKLKVTIN